MIRRFIAAFAVFLASAGCLKADPFIRIIQPYENQNIPAVKQTFVFGSVLPTSATVVINGIPVKPHTNGGFLAMIPLQPGRFKIEASVSDGVSTSTVVRMVNVADVLRPFPANSKKIDPWAPKVKLVVRPGDTVDLEFQGPPGGKAEFRIGKRGDTWPMEEQSTPVPGIYKGQYVVRAGDAFDKADAFFFLRRADGRKLQQKVGTEITVQRRRTPRLIELKDETILLTGPDTDYGYNLFAAAGTRFEVTGEWGDFLRVAVGTAGQNWIRRSAAIDLPAGAAVPKSVSRNLHIDADDDSTYLRIPLEYRHPYRVEQFVNPHSMRITLYGVVADSDRISYKSPKSVIKEVTWFQSDPDTCVIDVQTKQSTPWGYDMRYEGTTLVVEIRHRPHVLVKNYSLKGLKVAVDAGHSKEAYGTIGPWGNTEASINLGAAKEVAKELEKRGAEVLMTQDGTRELSLTDRTQMAWKARANIFISIHADACAEGQDPREVEGYSVHYYQPQSHSLAETIHAIYGEKTGLRDQGLWRSNLAVCRMTQMPSLLLEQAFLILPEYEELMLTDRHKKNVAESIVNGIITFLIEHPS